MAITLEQVEKLREKTGASYEACKNALERSDGDMLDAVIYLEKLGEARAAGKGSSFTTEPVESAAEAVKRALTLPTDTKKGKGKEKDADWKDWARDVGEMGVNLLRHSTVNQLEVWRHERMMTSIPILILALLIILAFWITIPLIIIGLFVGCRYRFVGPDLGKESINDVMDNVSATVDDMVGQVKREFGDSKEKAKKAEDAAKKAERQVDDLVKQAERHVDDLGKHIDHAADKIDKAFTYEYRYKKK